MKWKRTMDKVLIDGKLCVVVDVDEAEARLKAVEQTAHDLNGYRVYLEGVLGKSVDRTAVAERKVTDLEARLAAALACHMNCKDCDINQIAGKQEDRIAALEKLVCYTDDCTVRAVKP